MIIDALKLIMMWKKLEISVLTRNGEKQTLYIHMYYAQFSNHKKRIMHISGSTRNVTRKVVKTISFDNIGFHI